MMNRVVSYASGNPMSQQPGAVEAMAYLSSIEKDTMLGILQQPQPPPPPPPPPSLTSSMPPELSSYKDLVARRCEERGIFFAPTVPAKFYEGKQVYKCGSSSVFLDRNAIFVQSGDKWVPTSLSSLLDNVG
jgi:tuftelin-interacting protein 11